MLTEIGSASETAPATDKVQLTPKRVGAFIEYSKQALIQSGLALDGMLRDDLVTGAAVLLEYQAINGAGTGAHMLGIRNTTGIGTVVMGTAGAAPDWASVIALESKAADANAVAGALAGYLVNTKTRGKLKQTQRGTNLDFVWGDAAPGADGFSRLNGYRAGVSNNVVANLTKGSSTTVCSAGLFSSDWSMAVLAFFGAPDVVVDPYTLAATGQVRITLNQYADFGVRQPGAFAKVDDWLAG
jgi:HK97 family phage major capsid protein